MHAELLLDDFRQLGRGPAVTLETRGERAFAVNITKLSELIRTEPAGTTGSAPISQPVETLVIEGASPTCRRGAAYAILRRDLRLSVPAEQLGCCSQPSRFHFLAG